MKPPSLVIVLMLAKACGVSGHDLPESAWLPAALFWDDVTAGIGLWLIERGVKRPRIVTILYWAIVCWAALNVPVARALSSPLTANMIGAAGGPLFDSVVHYLTFVNVALVALVIGAAALLPAALPQPAARWRVALAAAAVGAAVPGPIVESRIDLHGLQRNAVTALIETSIPRVRNEPLAGDWRTSPFPGGFAEDLSALRSAAAGRNVVVIVLESTAARYLRSYGASDDPTPNLTMLAASAMQFTHTYAVYPESVKGLFAVLCSRAPAFDVSGEAHAASSCAPLPRLLSDTGYRTGLFHSGRFAYLGMDAIVSRQGFDTMEDAGIIGGNVQSSFGVDEPSTVQRILAWVDATPRSRPFFVAYLPAAGHHPYATVEPGPFEGRDDFDAYRNALFEGDRSVGVLLEGFRIRGLDRNTLFVIYGDHGEAFGQHDGNLGHTLSIYDENVRVPLLVAIPGVVTRHVPVGKVASVIDIAPTILDLIGAPIPRVYEGQSLLGARPRMALFYTDYSVGLLGLQDGCWKYHLDIDAARSRLFDTCTDPAETADRAGQHGDRVRAYGNLLQSWASATRSSIEDGSNSQPAASGSGNANASYSALY